MRAFFCILTILDVKVIDELMSKHVLKKSTPPKKKEEKKNNSCTSLLCNRLGKALL